MAYNPGRRRKGCLHAEPTTSVLLADLVRAIRPILVIETGTYYGNTASAIGRALSENGTGHLVTLETKQHRHRVAARRCRRLPVTCVYGRALDYTPTEPIGLLFIDSSLESRPQEFDHFFPWFKPSTLIVWHDTKDLPVLDHVRQLRKDGRIQMILLETDNGLCMANPLMSESHGRILA